MSTSKENLEELYSRLKLEEEEEEDGGIIIAKQAVKPTKNTYVLVGRFLTDKNINFNAMKNVLASLWRPREGMEIHDIGGQRFSFVFFHVLDMKKVLDGGPWTFEQNLLLYQKLTENEDPHLIQLNKMDIWIQAYDLPKGMFYENVFANIGNFVGTFVSSDPANVNGDWKMYARIRVTMDINKPLRRRMRIKREGGEWSWVNFKYERLSTLCFVCGMLGHLERDCGIVYANPDKEIARAYGVWLRAPTKNMRNQNMGARWLKNGGDENMTWSTGAPKSDQSSTGDGRDKAEERFMEVDGRITEIPGDDGGIRLRQRDQSSNSSANQGEDILGGQDFEPEIIVVDPKRRRTDKENKSVINGEDNLREPMLNDGPKNLPEAGPVLQARLDQ